MSGFWYRKYFKENNLKNVLVSNGYINETPWEKLVPFIDAANIDVNPLAMIFIRNSVREAQRCFKDSWNYS